MPGQAINCDWMLRTHGAGRLLSVVSISTHLCWEGQGGGGFGGLWKELFFVWLVLGLFFGGGGMAGGGGEEEGEERGWLGRKRFGKRGWGNVFIRGIKN